MGTEVWGTPEAMRLHWMTQRAVSILFRNMDNSEQEELVSAAIAITWENQVRPLSQHLVMLCAVKAFNKLYDHGRVLNEVSFERLTNLTVEQPELTDPPDNVVLLADWRNQITA